MTSLHGSQGLYKLSSTSVLLPVWKPSPCIFRWVCSVLLLRALFWSIWTISCRISCLFGISAFGVTAPIICPEMSAKCPRHVREMSVGRHLVNRYGQVRTTLVPVCLSRFTDIWPTYGGHLADTCFTFELILSCT